jgi:hypothetical protein
MSVTKRLDRAIDKAADAAVRHKAVHFMEAVFRLCVIGLWLCVALAAIYFVGGL